MASYIGDRSVLLKLFFLCEVIGDAFLSVSRFAEVARRYVIHGIFGEGDVMDCDTTMEEQKFISECKSLLYMNGSVCQTYKKKFEDFHDFTLGCGLPMGSILITGRNVCRRCNRDLVVDGKPHVVVIYHISRGSYAGSRLTKMCRKCKIYEHYGYWTEKGLRYFDSDCLDLDFLLSSEDTAFDVCLLRECSSYLVVGAVPFATCAASYNRRFGYLKSREAESKSKPKRMKRDSALQQRDLLNSRQFLDRRRLEEGFLLFGALEVIGKYNLSFDSIPFDRTKLVKMVAEEYQKCFDQKWQGHVCDVPGCKCVIVLDGNMKNARQVCACRDVGELYFDGMKGSIVVGCQNTPGKGSRYCCEHENMACKYIDDSHEMEEDKKEVDSEDVLHSADEMLPVKVLNVKETRQGKFYQLLWCDGSESWVKEANLPSKLFKVLKMGKEYLPKKVGILEFGQSRSELQLGENGSNTGEQLVVLKSSGFGLADIEDTSVSDDKGLRIIGCGTEKGRHKSKNYRTAAFVSVVTFRGKAFHQKKSRSSKRKAFMRARGFAGNVSTLTNTVGSLPPYDHFILQFTLAMQH